MYYPYETSKELTVDEECCQIARTLMEGEQSAIYQQTEAINKLTRLYEKTGREDIKEMIDDIKEELSDELDHVRKDEEWLAYFAGVKSGDEKDSDEGKDKSKDKDKGKKDEEKD